MICQFETPIFIYYSYSAVLFLIAALALAVLLQNKKCSINRSAFYFILIIALWIGNDFFQWITRDVKLALFSFRIAAFADAIFLLFLYFVYNFISEPISSKKKLFFALPFLFELFFVFSRYYARVIDASSCYFVDGPISYFGYVLDVFYVIMATSVLMKAYRDPKKYSIPKNQIKILILSIWFFLLASFIYWESWNISFSAEAACYFILSVLFFIAMIVFAIIKKDLFNLETVPRDWFALAVITSIFLLMLFFSISLYFTIVLIIAYLILMLIFWKM